MPTLSPQGFQHLEKTKMFEVWSKSWPTEYKMGRGKNPELFRIPERVKKLEFELEFKTFESVRKSKIGFPGDRELRKNSISIIRKSSRCFFHLIQKCFRPTRLLLFELQHVS